MEALEALAARHSSRAYRPDPVPKATLEKIIDAGRRAATAINVQPWEFVVVTDAATRQRIADITDHGQFIAQAPACVAVLCREGKYYLEDGCAATQNILVAAAALGVQSCWVAGDKKAYAGQIGQLLGVPATCKLVALIAMGYESEKPEPKPKRALAEVLHWEKF